MVKLFIHVQEQGGMMGLSMPNRYCNNDIIDSGKYPGSSSKSVDNCARCKFIFPFFPN